MTTVPVRRGVRVEVLQTLLSAEGGAPEGDAAACSRTFGARLPSLPWEPIKFLAVLSDSSVGGSFAARWARMVLKRCSSERGEREKRFYGDGKGERRRTAF